MWHVQGIYRTLPDLARHVVANHCGNVYTRNVCWMVRRPATAHCIMLRYALAAVFRSFHRWDVVTALKTTTISDEHDAKSDVQSGVRVGLRISMSCEGNIMSRSCDQLTEPFPPFMSSPRPKFSSPRSTKSQHSDIIPLPVIWMSEEQWQRRNVNIYDVIYWWREAHLTTTITTTTPWWTEPKQLRYISHCINIMGFSASLWIWHEAGRLHGFVSRVRTQVMALNNAEARRWAGEVETGCTGTVLKIPKIEE